MSPLRFLSGSITLALGCALGGFFIGHGIVASRTADRTVSVKGISERDVRADLAIWPLHVVSSSDDLAAANAQIQNSVRQVWVFLRKYGIDTAQASLQGFSVADASTNQFLGDRHGNRYVIRQTIVVRSTTPDLVLAASQRLTELVAAGVVLEQGGEYGSRGPTFVYRGLNTIKPTMIAEATARAREAAAQFARDAGSPLSGIRSAYQGQFSILPRDQAGGISEESQILKTVRVVSTVEYSLGRNRP